MANRLFLEDHVIKAIDKHITDDGKLDNDISCVLEEIPYITMIRHEKPGSMYEFGNKPAENNAIKKERRTQLYENEDIVLEQRGNKYYLSLFDKKGKFQREVMIAVKDNYKVSTCNGM